LIDRGKGDRDRWARLRFAIIGPLLAAPPAKGELQTALRELSARTWQHPVSVDRCASACRRWNAGFQRSKLFCGAERFRRVFPRRIPLFAPHNNGVYPSVISSAMS
jgi:hypothetical protein